MNEKQKCDMCNSLLARTFVDLKGKRIYLCPQDAFALLRISAKETPDSFSQTYELMSAMVYGKESDLVEGLPVENIASSIATTGQGVL